MDYFNSAAIKMLTRQGFQLERPSRDSVLSEDKCLQPASKLSGSEGPAARVGADGSKYTVREERWPWTQQAACVQEDFTAVTCNWNVTFSSSH